MIQGQTFTMDIIMQEDMTFVKTAIRNLQCGYTNIRRSSMAVIRYKGETLETKHYEEISDEEFEELKKQYYEKPDFEEVKKQLKSGLKIDKITNYYFKDIMAKVKIYSCKWSVEDVFENKELVGFFKSKTLDNKDVFPDNHSTIKKIETAIRLGGKGYAKKPTNFPLKTIDEVLEKYNINNNYYDYSCGWGVRLLSALRHNVNYYGTDPNYLLTSRLLELQEDYKKEVECDSVVDIRTQGSEVFIEEWENTMGLAFSSPPYYNLEDYKIGNQSYKQGVSYEEWKRNYLKPTFENIYCYLVCDGYFLLNINNFKDYTLVEDSIEIAEEIGFKLVGEHELKNIKRCKSNCGFNDNSERILVFRRN